MRKKCQWFRYISCTGDWFTATLINELAELRILSIEAYNCRHLVDIIRTAMEIAANRIGYMGSKGMIHYANSLQIEVISDSGL